MWFFLAVAIFIKKSLLLKWPPLSWLLNLAPSSIIIVWRKILKLSLFVQFFKQIPKLSEHYVSYDIQHHHHQQQQQEWASAIKSV